MDSVTQFTLGAVVSTLCLGKRMGPRKAALLGGLLGTLPDLDVLLPVANEVDAFVLHRGWTHSFFVHALAAPIIGEILVRTIKALKDARFRVWLAVFLIFSTHAIIDGITVYGTRLFWPFYPDPIGVGSMFIIDPLYTLPILAVAIWSFVKRDWSAALGRGLVIALVATTAYMGLGVVLQANAESRAKVIFADAGVEVRNIFAISGPFNVNVWKVIAQDDDHYYNLYLSLLDDDSQARIYAHPSRPDLAACLEGNDAFEKLKWFSRGYYTADLEEGQIVVSDLRMGLTPYYVFRFALAETGGDAVTIIEPQSINSPIVTLNEDLDWYGDRFLGRSSERAVEANVPGPPPAEELASC